MQVKRDRTIALSLLRVPFSFPCKREITNTWTIALSFYRREAFPVKITEDAEWLNPSSHWRLRLPKIIEITHVIALISAMRSLLERAGMTGFPIITAEPSQIFPHKSLHSKAPKRSSLKSWCYCVFSINPCIIGFIHTSSKVPSFGGTLQSFR